MTNLFSEFINTIINLNKIGTPIHYAIAINKIINKIILLTWFEKTEQ